MLFFGSLAATSTCELGAAGNCEGGRQSFGSYLGRDGADALQITSSWKL